MKLMHHNPAELFPPYRGYVHALEVANLVSLRTYLADPKYDEPNALMRAKQLGTHRVASTVIC